MKPAETRVGEACQLLASLELAGDAARRRHMGIGAFNLVRAEAYRAAGGHEALRLTVNEDWRLGLLLARAGRTTRAYLGAPDLEADWFGSAGGMLRAPEKNSFASLDYRLGRLARVVP